MSGSASRSARAGAGATDHAAMRRHNRALVLDLLLGGERASRSSIAERSGLAKPTVSLIVEDLLAERLVEEVGYGDSTATGGRPPTLLALRPDAAAVVGVHIGVTRTTVVVADAIGVELHRASTATPGSRPTAALRSIGKLIRETVEAAVPADRVAAVVVCLPGLVDVEDGNLLLASNLGWRDVAVTALLTAELGLPVTAVNTAQATLLAELQEGAAQGAREAVLVYAGSGVGAAIASRGALVSGGRGVAGELGHCRVRPDGPVCGCGKTGCLETVASADAVAREARRRLGRRAPATLTAQDVAVRAAEGDSIASEVLADSGRQIGAAAAWLVNLVDPDTVVLAGGLAGAGAVFTDAFEQALAADVLPAAGPRRVVLAGLGQDGEVRGALLLARERLRERLGLGPLDSARSAS